MAIHYGRSVSTSSRIFCLLLYYLESSRIRTLIHLYICVCYIHFSMLTYRVLMAGWKGVFLLFEEWAVQVWCYVQISSPRTSWLAVSSTITCSGYTNATSGAYALCLSSFAVSICSFVTTIWSNTCKAFIAVKPICSWPLWSYVGFPRRCSIPKLESLPSMYSSLSLTSHFISFYVWALNGALLTTGAGTYESSSLSQCSTFCWIRATLWYGTCFAFGIWVCGILSTHAICWSIKY